MITTYDNFILEKYYNKELNKKFWKDNKLDKEIKDKLISIAKDFYKSTDLKNKITDIVLTGSLANYNYNKYSDLDLHIVIDIDKSTDDIDMFKKFINDEKWIWNKKHNIKIKEHDVEVYIQDSEEEHTSSGVYSLLDDKWIIEPKLYKKKIDESLIIKKYNDWIFKITKLQDESYIKHSKKEWNELEEKTKELRDKLVKYRKTGLSKDGELSLENLVYKKLRNKNKIDLLFNLITTFYDNQYND